MEGVVNVEWHGQDYLHLKWHVVCSGLVTPGVSGYKLAFHRWDLEFAPRPLHVGFVVDETGSG